MNNHPSQDSAVAFLAEKVGRVTVIDIHNHWLKSLNPQLQPGEWYGLDVGTEGMRFCQISSRSRKFVIKGRLSETMRVEELLTILKGLMKHIPSDAKAYIDTDKLSNITRSIIGQHISAALKHLNRLCVIDMSQVIN